jgi:pSer/pThr/pTyr-binding forkhead associated (FHA) protein
MPDENLIRIRLSLKGRPIKSYSFNQDVITVGRDPAADIYLDNPGVSREHCRLERLPNGHYCVKDANSANGTFLNDERVETALVYNSDVLLIGKYSLWLSFDRDRRGGETIQSQPRVAPEHAAETMMLSTQEIERLMSQSKNKDTHRESPLETIETASRVELESSPEPRSRVQMLIGIGAVLVLATSVGAGIAWLFLR